MAQHSKPQACGALAAPSQHASRASLTAVAFAVVLAANAFSQVGGPVVPPAVLVPIGPLVTPRGTALEREDVFTLALRTETGVTLHGTTVTASMLGFASGMVGITDSEGCIAFRCPPGLLRLSYSDPAAGPQNVAYRKSPDLAHSQFHFTGDPGLENNTPNEDPMSDTMRLSFSHTFGDYAVFGCSDGTTFLDADMDGLLQSDGPVLYQCSVCPDAPSSTISYTTSATYGPATSSSESTTSSFSKSEETERSITGSNGGLTKWYADLEGGVTWKNSTRESEADSTSTTETDSESRSSARTLTHECSYSGTPPYRQHHELRMSYTRQWTFIVHRINGIAKYPTALRMTRRQLHLYAQHWRVVPAGPVWHLYDGSPCYQIAGQVPSRKGRSPFRFTPPLPTGDIPPIPLAGILWTAIPPLEGMAGLNLAGLVFPERTFPLPLTAAQAISILNSPELQVRPAGWSVR